MASKIIIAAGGTLGHIRPALAVKQELEKIGIKVDFFCALKDQQFEVVKAEKRVKYIKMLGLPRSKNPFKILWFSTLLFRSLFSVGSYFLFKRPKLVVGCGGFVSFPILFWSFMLRVPYLLLEQNSVPGVVSRIFFRKARHIFLSMPLLKMGKRNNHRVSLVGNPIKINHYSLEKAINILDITKKKQFFERKVLGVMGGSLGALGINDWIVKNLADLKKLNLSCILITGKKNHEIFKHYQNESDHLWILPFVRDIGAFYSIVNLLVSRAGASSISELTLLRKPAILIPYPFASDNHQYFNAQFALTQFKSLLIQEKELESYSLEKAIQCLERVESDFSKTANNQALDAIISFIKKELL